jgi:hypothetical protein
MQRNDERGKCSYPFENREKVRGRYEVQEVESEKAKVKTSSGGAGIGRLEERACAMKCPKIPHMH